MRPFLFLAALLCAAVSPVFAQTEKGRWMVGGSGTGYFDNSDTDLKQTLLLLTPSAGHFVARNVALGASLPLFYSRTKTSGSFGTSHVTAVGLSPFARFYVGQSQVKPFLQGQIGYMRASYKSSGGFGGGNDGVSDGQFVYGGAAGMAFFLNEHSSLDLSLNYLGGDRDDAFGGLLLAGTSPRTLTLNIGFQLFLGKAK